MLDEVKAAIAEVEGFLAEIKSAASEAEASGTFKPKQNKAIRENAKAAIASLKVVRFESKTAYQAVKAAKKKAKEEEGDE